MNDVQSIPAKSTTRAPTNWTQTLGILPILILLYLFFFALSENFRSLDNLINILRTSSINIVLATGMTFVILTGGIDLAVGSVLGATAVGIGRPYVWGLGAFGQPGVEKVIDLLLAEFTMAMRQTRTTAIDQIKPGFVMEGRTPIMMRNNALGFGL